MPMRDYHKFLRADGRLDVKLIPRPVYMTMLNEYKRRDVVIIEVFGDLHWRWDLDRRWNDASAAGSPVSRTAVATEIMGEMDDREWWRATAAFEEHLMRSFADDPEQWSHLLDPIYDWQEREGWADRHYAAFPASGEATDGVKS
jgi:hypothetical protein